MFRCVGSIHVLHGIPPRFGYQLAAIKELRLGAHNLVQSYHLAL
jgi:hypothetical protein